MTSTRDPLMFDIIFPQEETLSRQTAPMITQPQQLREDVFTVLPRTVFLGFTHCGYISSFSFQWISYAFTYVQHIGIAFIGKLY